MPVRKRVGPLPEGHPLAGGKTIMFGVGKQQVTRKKQVSTTTHEEQAIILAAVMWQKQEQERLNEGLPLRSQDEYLEYMMEKKAEYYAKFKGETDEEGTGADTTNAEGSKGPDQPTDQEVGGQDIPAKRDSFDSVSGVELRRGDTGGPETQGTGVRSSAEGSGGSIGSDVIDGEGGI